MATSASAVLILGSSIQSLVPFFPSRTFARLAQIRRSHRPNDAIRQSAARIRDVAPLYPNYAMFDTPLSDMCGENVEKLRSLSAEADG